VRALQEGGSYTEDNRLRYPIDAEDPLKAAQTLAFGTSAAQPEDYDWQSGTLSEKETAAYEAAVEAGADEFDVYEALVNFNAGTNAEKGLSLAAGTQDMTKEQQDIIAAMLELNYNPEKDGTLAEWGAEQAENYLSQREKRINDEELSEEEREKAQREYDEKFDIFEEYFRLLGMNGAG